MSSASDLERILSSELEQKDHFNGEIGLEGEFTFYKLSLFLDGLVASRKRTLQRLKIRTFFQVTSIRTTVQRCY